MRVHAQMSALKKNGILAPGAHDFAGHAHCDSVYAKIAAYCARCLRAPSLQYFANMDATRNGEFITEHKT